MWRVSFRDEEILHDKNTIPSTEFSFHGSFNHLDLDSKFSQQPYKIKDEYTRIKFWNAKTKTSPSHVSPFDVHGKSH